MRTALELPQELLSMIRHGENYQIEYKEAKTELPKSLFDTVCAFSNREGGDIFLGVHDCCVMLGVDPAAASKLITNFVTQANNKDKVFPPLYLTAREYVFTSDGSFIGTDKKGKKVQEQSGEHHIIHIHVPVSPSVIRHRGRIFDRNDDADMDITDLSDRVFQCYARKQSTYYVNKVYPHWSVSDLRSDLIDKAREMAIMRKQLFEKQRHPWADMDNEELLRTSGLILTDEEGRTGITLAAVLLFGTDNMIASACAHHTAESWAVLQAALEMATAVVQNESATQDEVDSSFSVLANAKAALVLITIDKTSLEIAISSVPTEGFYVEDDRYNGKEISVNGFWTDMQTALTAAQAVMNNVSATQAQVDAAAEALTAAIAKLIPTTLVNATALYEAANRDLAWADSSVIDYAETDGSCPRVTAENTSPASWAAYQAALAEANTILGKLYDENGEPMAYNSSTEGTAVSDVESATAALQNAIAGLDKLVDKELEYGLIVSAKMAYDGLNKLANVLFNAEQMNATDYTGESWSAFVEARNTALAFVGSHHAPTDVLGQKEAKACTDAYYAFWKACYETLTGVSSGSASISITDNHAVLSGVSLTPYAGTYTVAVPENGVTLGEALAGALGSGYQLARPGATDCAVGIYVNGAYIFTLGGANDAGGDLMSLGYQNIRLESGDNVVVAFMKAPTETNASNSTGVVRAYQALSKLQFYILSKDGESVDTLELTAGDMLTLNAGSELALPNVYTGTLMPLSGAAVYVSEPCATEAEARKSCATVNTGTVTGSDGTLQISVPGTYPGQTEGWYVLSLIGAGESGGLVNGANVILHVTDPADISGIKAEYKARLDEVYTAYDDSFYTEAQLAEVKQLYETGTAGIAAAADSGAVQTAFTAAYEGITAIQTANAAAENLNLYNVRWLLDRLPSAEELADGKLYSGDKVYLDYLFNAADGIYGSMSQYQLDQLSVTEASLLSALKEAYEQSGNGTSLPETPEITVTITLRDAATDEIVDDSALKPGLLGHIGFSNMAASLTTNSSNDQGKLNAIPLDTHYFDNGGKVPAGAVSLGLQAQLDGYTVTSISHNLKDEVKPWFDNAETVPGIRLNGKNVRSDVEITVYVSDASGAAAAALASAKEAAVAAIETAYGEYKQADYSEANWAVLTAAKDTGLSSVESAATVDAVNAARQEAIKAMAAVKTIAQENSNASEGGESGVALPDYGSVVGQVHIIVENQTFISAASDGSIPAWSGTLIDGWYDLCERDTMMTSILKALQLKGCNWSTGSQGVADVWDDYGISYLASIKVPQNINADGSDFVLNNAEETLAEFSGEPGSGWMGMLNDWFTGYGFNEFGFANGTLQSGDEIHVLYTQNLGQDVDSVWGDPDTSLRTMTVTGGTLAPEFDGATTSYTLTLSSGAVSVMPSAKNKNYQVRTFVNEKSGDNWYRRGTTLPVKAGDTIYVGVGDKTWPSMNNNEGYAISYSGTWYAIKVIDSSSADSVVEMIKSLPTITYSNYKAQQKNIELARSAYDALTAEAKAKVTNLDKLEKAEEAVKKFEQVDEVKDLLAALPKSANLTDAQVKALKNQIEAADAAYKALSPEQQGYITVGDVANYNELVERLAKLTPDTTAETITGSEGIPGASETIPAEDIAAAAEAGQPISVETEDGSVTLPAEAVKELAEAGEDVEVSVTKNEDGTVTVNVTVGGEPADVDVKVALPASEDGQVLVIVNPDGSEEIVKKSFVENGTAYAEIPAGATVKVIENAMHFIDVADNAWYADEVEFASSHGLFQGVGNNKFAPAAPMTRAMLATVLYRLEDAVATGANPFADVADGTWYTEAVIWASAEGIVQGTGKGFEPNENITREQIATMLYRYAKTIGLDVSGSAALNKFSDGDKTSSWAKDAMQWAVSVGLFQGDDVGTLRPQGDATRAEVAALLMRMVKLIVK